MKENFRFNYGKINTEIFESDLNIDELIDEEKNEVEIHEKCKHYESLDYPIKLSKVTETTGDYWLAEHEDLPGCITHGKSKEEALNNLEDAKRGWIFAKLSEGGTIPSPSLGNTQDFRELSGKILLRIPKELHYKISQLANANSVSINQELIYLLSCAVGEVTVAKNILGDLNQIKEILQRNFGTKNNLDVGLSYSKFVAEISQQISQEFKNLDRSLYHDEDSSFYEQPKKVFKRPISPELN